MTKKINIHLGHSPDSDDAFMFYAIAKNKIDTDKFNFIHVIEDIETLNQKALNNELEISAVSIHAYTAIHKNYALLSAGASMGNNYGPIIISNNPINKNLLKNKTIAIPGKLTSAFLAMQIFEQNFKPVFIPFNKIINAVKNNNVDAGIIIHEGQLLYKKLGLHAILDLGKWWYQKHQLPLPLGANAIKRSLPYNDIKKISAILKESIQYSLNNRKNAMNYAMKYAGNMDPKLADQFVAMYVNNYTLDFGQKGKQSVKLFLNTAYQKGIIKENINKIDFL